MKMHIEQKMRHRRLFSEFQAINCNLKQKIYEFQLKSEDIIISLINYNNQWNYNTKKIQLMTSDYTFTSSIPSIE